MTAPEFGKARRQLRRARIQDAIGLDRQVDIAGNRNTLLELLAAQTSTKFFELAADLDAVRSQFGDLEEDAVDLTVSLALADVEESDIDRVAVTALCFQSLARDGQFARLSQLSGRLNNLGERFRLERPFLAAVLTSLSEVVRERRASAIRHLDALLGFSDQRPEPRQRTAQAVDDLLVATAVVGRVG
jgi:hypothetical protein